MPARRPAPDNDEPKIVETFVASGHPIMALMAMLIRRPKSLVAIITLTVSTILIVAGYTPPSPASIVAALPHLKACCG